MTVSHPSLRLLLERFLRGDEDFVSLLPLAVLFVELRPTLRLAYVSPQFEQLTGYSAESMVADLEFSTSVVVAEDLPRIVDGFTRLQRDGDRFSGELRLRCSDGEVRWFGCEAIARACGGEALAAILTVADVTHRKSVEIALDSERRERQSLIDALPGVVYEMTMSERGFHPTYVSAQVHAMTGYLAEELLSDRTLLPCLVHPEDLPALGEALYRTWVTGTPGECVYRFLRRDGSTGWARNRWSVMPSPAPGTVKIRGIVVEVSEQKEAEARAEETNRIYRTLIEHIPGFVFVVRLSDLGFQLVYLSPQARDFLQRDLEPILAGTLTDWAEFIHADDLSHVLAEAQRVLETREPARVDVRFLMRDGSWKWTRTEASVISGPRNRWVDVLGVGRDVTFEREAEERSRRQRELEAQLMRADRLAAVGQLAAGIAHEVNNALASLLPYGSLIAADAALPAQVRDHGRQIEQQSQRIAAIVRGLLNLVRQQLPRKARWSLAELVNDTLTLVGAEARRADISVTVAIAPEITVLGDRGQLQQVFLNLISNAIQAMNDQPERRLQVSALEGCDEVTVRIADSGPGVLPEVRARLFTGFVTTRPYGSGLGLNISASIARAHGGEISLDATVPRGAAFVVRLPSGGGVEESAGPAAAAPATPPADHPIRALIVDDEPGVRAGFTRLLERDGVHAESVSDGASALRQLEEGDYDVVFLDLRMPGMSGIDVYERLRQSNPRQAERVVIMTADVASLEVRVFLDSVKRPVLLKPFDLGTVREVIHRAAH